MITINVGIRRVVNDITSNPYKTETKTEKLTHFSIELKLHKKVSFDFKFQKGLKIINIVFFKIIFVQLNYSLMTLTFYFELRFWN